MASATLPRKGPLIPFDHVVGIDTHRDFHVAVVLAPNGGKVGELTFPTSSKGYEQLVNWSEQFGVRPVFAMEGTGSYGAGLCRTLLDAAYDVIEVNRPDRAARRRHGKDDPVDAEAAARAFLAGTATIIPKRGGDQVEMIRLLKVAKDSAIDGRTRAMNQVRSLLVTAPVALRERLKGLGRSELIATCVSFRPGILDGPMAAAKRALRSLARRIQALDAELEALMDDLDALTQAACPGLRQSFGIGVDGAAVLLAAVGDNPERIRSEAAFAAICGASPMEASSGNKRHHRLNRGGNRQANATLHRIAVVRLRWHEQTKAYAERRKAEGLSNKDILRCLKRFIAREVFHLLMGKPPRRTTAS
jgi:transposase